MLGANSDRKSLNAATLSSVECPGHLLDKDRYSIYFEEVVIKDYQPDITNRLTS